MKGCYRNRLYIYAHPHTYGYMHSANICTCFPFKYISWVKSIYCTWFLLLVSLNIISSSIIHLVSISFLFFFLIPSVSVFIFFLAHLFLISTEQNIIIGRTSALQYCAGLCHTATRISHRYTYVPSLLNCSPIFPTIPPPGCHRTLGWAPCRR